MSTIKIAVAYHKQAPIISSDIYVPLHVGKALNQEVNLGIQGDDEGLNISNENGYYCELTATYWIWKNIRADYKGLCHYRRFFLYKPSIEPFFKKLYGLLVNGTYIPQTIYGDENIFKRDIYETSNSLKKYLDVQPIITTRKVVSRDSCYKFFVIIGDEYISLMQEVIRTMFPDYFVCMQNALNSHSFHFANMVVMRTDYFDEYCTFMFGVLEKIKELLLSQGWLVDLKKERIFARKLGYLAELLTNIYIQKKSSEGVRVKMMNIAYLHM